MESKLNFRGYLTKNNWKRRTLRSMTDVANTVKYLPSEAAANFSQKFRKIHRKTPVPEFLPATLSKRDFGTGVFV